MDWLLQDENYDYHQEIARSAYADMLHDTERNQKYYTALKKAVKYLHSQGKKANVLDIGTGTGLLSMMAATVGADSVTACEAFTPMAHCAKKIIKKNNLAEKIHLIPKRSTAVTVGPDGDMKQRANILVTEVFDTELIGEGAIGTFNHAHKELLEVECLVIPRAANMYAQPVRSQFIRRWNQIDAGQLKVAVPPAVSQCGGAPSLHDLQLDQIPQTSFIPLSDPVNVFRFDFSASGGLEKERRSEQTLTAADEGQVDAIFMWWDCEMDHEGEITLSCAPNWAHPDGKNLPWRDHWMQAIYYPGKPLPVTRGQRFSLLSCHDEYSLWFDVCALSNLVSVMLRPICSCGFHTTLSRTRLGMLGDPLRQQVLLEALTKTVGPSSVVLCVSDASLLPILSAKMGAKKVFVIESSPLYSRITQQLLEESGVADCVTVIDKKPEEISSEDLDNNKIDVVVGEPYFAASLLPWHQLYMWYAVSELSKHLTPGHIILPGQMVVRAVAVQFEHLWKIRAPVGDCEGFNLDLFDKLVQGSSSVSDHQVEPQPLWEYPGTALSQPVTLMTLAQSDFNQTSAKKEILINIESAGNLNGVALWADFVFGENASISTGPCGCVAAGDVITWDPYTRQGVHLLPAPRAVRSGDAVTVTVHFHPDTGEFDFAFKT